MRCQSIWCVWAREKNQPFYTGDDHGLCRQNLGYSFYNFLCNYVSSFFSPLVSGVEPQRCDHVDWSAN